MAKGTNFAGVTPAHADDGSSTLWDPFEGVDEEPPRYHAVVS